MLDLKTEPFGLPYNFHEFQEYCQRMGMEHHITTPEDAQANGFAEAFVKIMVKLVHTAVIEKQDPRKRVNKFLLARDILKVEWARMTNKCHALFE